MLGFLNYIFCSTSIVILAILIDGVSAESSIQWSACNNTDLQAFSAECAFISVPLDHDQPRGRKIRLALSRLRHNVSDDSYQGVVLVIPGGPGGSGLRQIRIGKNVPNNTGATYDWIDFDPRGVGSSQPSLSWIEDYSYGPCPISSPPHLHPMQPG